MKQGFIIQTMGPEDLAFAVECTSTEGWVSENLALFEDFYNHDPQGCFIARKAGEPVGICIATAYSRSGFVGELIVRAGVRQRGIGAALLNHAVEYLRRRGARSIYLDGVIAAISFYEHRGFRKICRSLRISGHLPGKQHPQVRAMHRDDLPQVITLDRQAFGDDRSFFLKSRLDRYPQQCKVQVDAGEISGYIMGRRGEGFMSAGPGVLAGESDDPLPLLETFASQAGKSGFSLGVLEANTRAVALLRSLGFAERQDNPWRMALGPDDSLSRLTQCFAIGSAAKG